MPGRAEVCSDSCLPGGKAKENGLDTMAQIEGTADDAIGRDSGQLTEQVIDQKEFVVHGLYQRALPFRQRRRLSGAHGGAVQESQENYLFGLGRR